MLVQDRADEPWIEDVGSWIVPEQEMSLCSATCFVMLFGNPAYARYCVILPCFPIADGNTHRVRTGKTLKKIGERRHKGPRNGSKPLSFWPGQSHVGCWRRIWLS